MQVQDLGRPRLTAQAAARVVIYVTDVNDSPPMFPHKIFNETLLLPTYKDVLVANLNATDKDSGTGGSELRCVLRVCLCVLFTSVWEPLSVCVFVSDSVFSLICILPHHFKRTFSSIL